MNDEAKRPQRHDPFSSSLPRLLGGMILLSILYVLGSERAVSVETVRVSSDEDELDRDFRSYVYGLGLAFVLSSVPFGLVYWHLLPHMALMIGIGLFAFVQIIIHFRFFLHIDMSKQKREDLELILFSSLILIVMVSGTIWLLFSLHTRMH